jgi:hypothetical protein
VLAIAGCAVAITLVAWPIRTLWPAVGGDFSWVGVLSYAAEHGLPFGQHLVFSYGPLGFLDTWLGPRLYYGDLMVAAWLYRALVQLLLAGTLLVVLRRSFPLPVAALGTAVTVALITDAPLGLGFAWCMLLLTRERERPEGPWDLLLPIALGALIGVVALGKLNQGGELLALIVIAVVAAPRRREAVAFGVTWLAVCGTGWLATGQSLGDVWPYIRNGLEVVAGYPAGMSTERLDNWAYPVAAVVAVLALVLAWDHVRVRDARRRIGVLALCIVYTVFAYKEGFTLADDTHFKTFLSGMLVVFAVLPVRPRRQPLLLAGLAAGTIAFGVVAGQHEMRRTFDPFENVAAVADQVRTIASASRRETTLEEVRAAIVATYGVPPRLLAAIGDRPMMWWPIAYGDFAWAHELKLRPLVTLEPYAAWRPRLDRLAAEQLASERAPERILQASTRHVPSVIGAHPTHLVPLAAREILCRYRPIAKEDPWQVLARGADRCGSERTLGSTTVAWGERVAVPAARRRDALVLVRIAGAGPQGLEHLTDLLLRPRHRWIRLDGEEYYLIAATAADGLLLSARPEADYPAPFSFAPNPKEIAIGRFGGEPDGELRYTFAEVAIEPLPGRGTAGR